MTAVAPPSPFIAPSRDQRAWERLVVYTGNIPWESPGTVTINGADIEDAWDIKDAQGQDGAKTERKGQRAQTFESEHRLSDVLFQVVDEELEETYYEDDHAGWSTFQWVLRTAMRSKPPAALSVRHPKLALKEIDAAVPTKIVGPDVDGEGFTVFTVSWLVYAPVVQSGDGSGDGPEQPDKKTQADKDLEKELKEYDRLQDEWKEL